MQNLKGKICHISLEGCPNTKPNSINSDSNCGETPSIDNGMRIRPAATDAKSLT